MRRLSAQVQLYIAIAVIVVLVLLVSVVGILPLIQEASAVDDQILVEQQSLVSAQALLDRRQSVKAQSAASEVELMRIANQIPHSPQLPSVIIELQDLANQADVNLQSISPGEIAIATRGEDNALQEFSVVPVSLVVRGQWGNLVDYLKRISRLDRGVRTTSASFAYVGETDTERAYVESGITIEVYVMPEVGPEPTEPIPTTETP